tara:strand:- start:14829 stop:16229 length:1401 start_codon:yes stop_codon:yes gene_type:complete
MTYKNINSVDISEFNKIIGDKNTLLEKDVICDYSHDYTEDLKFNPDVVLKPKNTQEVSLIMKYCNTNKIPVTPCGARTGLSGGSLPVLGGVSLSLERLNTILDIDTNNLQATVEPGVITEVFQNKVKEFGLFYPPDPASKGSCTLGGNIAENSGGPKALKYGVTKDYVLNMEVVMPNGDIIWTGANVLKNSTGYNLTSLIVGSEGTLAIVTKIIFKLIPSPKEDITLLASFKSVSLACEAVAAIFMNGIVPSALEFMERDAILLTIKYLNISINLADDTQAQLLIEVDGQEKDDLYNDCQKISDILVNFHCNEILVADTNNEKDLLWNLRRNVGEAVKQNSIYKEEDTVVPRYELPKLILGVKKIEEKYGFKSICYGHAGDGNLHINIIKENMSEYKWKHEIPIAIREIFTLTKSLGGTISGEHGIGYVQKEYLDIVFSINELELQKSIKSLFDPNLILNPSKIFR